MAATETILFEVAVQADDSSTREVQKVDDQIESLEKSFADLQERSEITGDQLQNATVIGAKDAQKSMEDLSRTVGSTSNQLAFTLVEGAQDAQFGLAGLANQIPQAAEEFGRLKTQTGSTTGALTSLLQTFTGPTGLLAIGTLGLQALPSILELFSGIEEGAEDASEATKQFESVLQSRLSSLADERQLGQVNTIIDNLEQRLQELRDSQLPDDELVIGFQTEEGEFLRSEEAGLSPPEGATPVTAADRIEQIRGELERVREKREQIKREIGRANALRRAGVELAADEADAEGGGDFEFPETDAGPPARRAPTADPRSFMPSEDELEDQVRDVELEPLTRSAKEAGDTLDRAVAQQLSSAIQLTFQLGESLATAFQKGEVEANELLGQILQITGSALSLLGPQGQVAGAVLSGFGGLLGAFDEGGYTGDLPTDQVAGVVHGGEYVMSAEAVQGQVSEVHAVHELMKGGFSLDRILEVSGVPGYADGGLVAGDVAAMTQPVVSIDRSGGQQSSDTAALRRSMNRIGRLIQDQTERLAAVERSVVVDRSTSRQIQDAAELEVELNRSQVPDPKNA